MIPNPVDAANLLEPPIIPLPALQVDCFPNPRVLHSHFPQRASLGSILYLDLYAYAWYTGGGYLTLNRGRKGLRRTSHGVEDGLGSTRT